MKCFAQEHNIMFPAWDQPRNARSGVESTKHEASAPPRSLTHLTHGYIYDIFLEDKPTLSSPMMSATMANDVTNIIEFPAPMMIVGA